MKKVFLSIFLPCIIFVTSLNAADLFDKDRPIQDGLNVFEVSEVFTDIYKKLDQVSWGGKNINIALESLENISLHAHIAATEDRVVLVWKDSIVANYPRPDADDMDGFGQITTALVLKFRALIPEFKKASQSAMYQTVVDSLVRGIDENGRYIYSKQAEVLEDGRILTSIGLEGVRDERGNFRVQGVYKNSSADISGIKSGDLIKAINGVLVSDMTNYDIDSMFSGFNSGTLKLKLLTVSGEKSVVLRRATIVLADADIVHRTDVENNLDILEIIVHRVSDASVSIINEALAKHYNTSGIILDLRSAAGDNLRAAAKLSGLFLGKIPVMRIVETAKSELEVVPGGKAVTSAPVVVLVSNTTSGTAEAIASAFYENNRGVLVGTPTSGSARIATRIDLNNGGALELLNRVIKTGGGNDIEGRGVFPLVCLSNIRSDEQQGAFFLNVINNDFKAKDFNKEINVSADVIRKGCPVITSGADEDSLAAAVSVKILTDQKIYNKLMNEL